MKLSSSSYIMLAAVGLLIALIFVFRVNIFQNDPLEGRSVDQFPAQVQAVIQQKSVTDVQLYLDSMLQTALVQNTPPYQAYIAKLKTIYDGNGGQEEKLVQITALALEEYQEALQVNANNSEGIQQLQSTRTKLFAVLIISLTLMVFALIRLWMDNRKKQEAILKLEKRADDLNQKLHKMVAYKEKHIPLLQAQVSKQSLLVKEYQLTINKLREKLIVARKSFLSREAIIEEISKITGFNHGIQVIKEIDTQLIKSNDQFYNSLTRRHPFLTARNIRMCVFLKMNLSTKEIATLMHTSIASVKMARSRLRKKFGINGTEVALSTYLNTLKIDDQTNTVAPSMRPFKQQALRTASYS